MKYTMKLMENGWHLFEDEKDLGICVAKAYKKDRFGKIYKLPKNALEREWIQGSVLNGLSEFDLTEKRGKTPRTGNAGGTSTGDKKVTWIEHAKEVLTEKEFELLQKLVNKVNAADMIAKKKAIYEQAKAEYEALLKATK